MKGMVKEAFTPEPITPNLKGVFIDGQIQLMKPQFIDTMDLFFKIQFANIINRYLKDGPDDMVVVLAFDDYNNVPCAKSMTQMKRKQRVTDVLPFTETDEIPMRECPPNWEGAMCNRVFKTKLIRKITEKMGQMVTLRKQQRLIVDFIGDPIEYSTVPGSMSMGGDSPCFARHIQGVNPIGEADCKMPRWVDFIAFQHPNRAVDVIVEATDSDYIMIAMLHYEKQVKLIMTGGGSMMGRISIRRIQCSGKDHAAGERAKKEVAGAAAKGTARKKRCMEFIHVPLLCEVMTSVVSQFFEGNTPMRCLTALIALGGNDFCRNIPRYICLLPLLLLRIYLAHLTHICRIGAHRMWELLPLVLGKNTKLNIFKKGSLVPGACAMDVEWNLFDEDVICDFIIAR